MQKSTPVNKPRQAREKESDDKLELKKPATNKFNPIQSKYKPAF